MKKTALYVGAILVMLLLVLFVPYRDKLKVERVAAAASPLPPSFAPEYVSFENNVTEGDPLDVPFLLNSEVFQEHLKVDDFAGISDSIVSVMQCIKDSFEDPAGYYESNTSLVLNTFGFGDKDVFLSIMSSLQSPPSYAVVTDVVKKDGYFYVAYMLYNKDDKLLCNLGANHLFVHNRYVASEYRLKD